MLSRKTALAAAATAAFVLLLSLSLSSPATALHEIAVAQEKEVTLPLVSGRERKPEPPRPPPSEPPSPPPPPPSGKTGGGASAFALLAAAYSLLGAIAAVQLYRIHSRVPEFGWTTQKVFHALNAAVCLLRAGGFAMHPWLEARAPAAVAEAVFDAPGLLFFTTYTLLVLFWAEIYHQARVGCWFVCFFLGGGPPQKTFGGRRGTERERKKKEKKLTLSVPSSFFLLPLPCSKSKNENQALPTGALRPAVLAANGLVYGVQAALWVWGAVATPRGASAASEASSAPRVAALAFLAAASAAAAAGFVVYGGRLFLMLRRFPIESRGRQKKLREVGAVAATCALCFGARACAAAWLAASPARGAASLDVAGHAPLNLCYYGVSELLPSALVLYILRRLPPKRAGEGYQQIPASS